MNFRLLNNITGWLVFAIATITYALSAEPSGSLWDCGEFIAGATKLQVVHPPGAPFFLLVGRMFTWVASLVSKDAANMAYAVNLLSGICTAFAAMFMCWVTTILGRIALVGRDGEPDAGQSVAILTAGLIAGLCTTFTTSVWFSAVEGEVYAMSLFFTAIVIWAMMKWYQLPDEPQHDRWLIFAAYMVGMSIGVHLLSLLAIPGLSILYYFKKNKTYTARGFIIAGLIGVALLGGIQIGVILYLPSISGWFELLFVNSFGLPFGSGLVFFMLLLLSAIVVGLHRARLTRSAGLERGLLAFAFIVLGFSTYAITMIRANASTPINMNNPSDVFNFVSYLSREQYGDRPLLYGPHFAAQPSGSSSSDKYGPVGDKYEVVDKKYAYEYNSEDKMLFPRIGHSDRVQEHLMWMGINNPREFGGKPSQLDNMEFFFRYQFMWEYVRYFMWNFAGRQNANQGYFDTDPTDGNWLSGFGFYDSMRLYDQSILPDRLKHDEGRNTYYMLPLIFGLLGAFFHFRKNSENAWVVLALFFMLGFAISIYSNQPPNEPRERDYAIAGSMMMFSVWIGMGVLALYDLLISRLKNGLAVAGLSTVMVGLVPLLMVTQNWDDHSRAGHYAARDYASNFLNSCAKDAIIFTFGDNDTYPLWYAQEVEGIRTDVRVVNLSLLAVDWYIDQLRRKVNQAPAIKMTISPDAYRGYKRNQVFLYPPDGDHPTMAIKDVVKFLGEDHPLSSEGGNPTESYLPTNRLTIPVDKAALVKQGLISEKDSVGANIAMNIQGKKYLIKDEVAILDIIANNLWDRPIYFAVTCSPDKMLGLSDYAQLEGLALRIIPVQSKGRPEFGGMIGGGRVATDIMYKNVTEKFKWGNFNKGKTFIDKSYFPSVISTRFSMLRLSEDLLRVGEYDKAVKTVDAYFAAFPNNNFQYDYNTAFFLRVYAEAAGLGKDNVALQNPAIKAKQERFGGKAETVEKLKKHLEILATETSTMRKFYANPAVSAYFGQELEHINGMKQGNRVQQGAAEQILNMADEVGDDAFAKKIKKIMQ